MQIIGQHVPKGGYIALIHFEPSICLTWAVLASWVLNTEVLEPLNLRRRFDHITSSPGMGEKVQLDCLKPVNMGTRKCSACESTQCLRTSSVYSLSSHLEEYPLSLNKVAGRHRQLSIGVQPCPSTKHTFTRTRETLQKCMQSCDGKRSRGATSYKTT